ncbi:MAG: hypothetical protein KDA88_23035 [Planctomycetaceae bacterium]|nr:hypothetical protein [Planctomycetaceae bacterium]MCA9030887.1 hypothetical protein [Planctomycetaceae bacterium]MCB9951749.1 hypothetical protein [Planctomycetaceae bacterium]
MSIVSRIAYVAALAGCLCGCAGRGLQMSQSGGAPVSVQPVSYHPPKAQLKPETVSLGNGATAESEEPEILQIASAVPYERPSASAALSEFEVVRPTPAEEAKPRPAEPAQAKATDAPTTTPVITSDRWTTDSIPVIR